MPKTSKFFCVIATSLISRILGQDVRIRPRFWTLGVTLIIWNYISRFRRHRLRLCWAAHSCPPNYSEMPMFLSIIATFFSTPNILVSPNIFDKSTPVFGRLYIAWRCAQSRYGWWRVVEMAMLRRWWWLIMLVMKMMMMIGLGTKETDLTEFQSST